MARKGYLTASFTLPDGKRKYVYAKTQEELDKKVFDLKMQLHMAPKKDRAGSVKARGYDHPAAARSRARVDGGLNRGSTERLAARGCAEIDD